LPDNIFAIANDRDYLAGLVLQCSRNGHAEARRYRSARMADAKHIERTLAAFRKRGEAVFPFNRVQLIAAPGNDLMRIRLVTDIPDQPVVGRVEYVVQRDRQFDSAEAGGKMPAHGTDRFDKVPAQLLRHRSDLVGGQPAQIFGRVDCR
jgi:hypothetical protein